MSGVPLGRRPTLPADKRPPDSRIQLNRRTSERVRATAAAIGRSTEWTLDRALALGLAQVDAADEDAASPRRVTAVATVTDDHDDHDEDTEEHAS